MTITVVFDPPLPSDSPSTFNTKAFTLLGDLNTWSTQANALPASVASSVSAVLSSPPAIGNVAQNTGAFSGLEVGSNASGLSAQASLIGKGSGTGGGAGLFITNGGTQVMSIGNYSFLNGSAYSNVGRIQCDFGLTIGKFGADWMSFNASTGAVTIPGALHQGEIVGVLASTYTVGAKVRYIVCNLAGTITLTLPSPSAACREIIIKTIQAQAVVSASSNVYPLGSATLGTAILSATAGKWATLVSDGAYWSIMAGN